MHNSNGKHLNTYRDLQLCHRRAIVNVHLAKFG